MPVSPQCFGPLAGPFALHKAQDSVDHLAAQPFLITPQSFAGALGAGARRRVLVEIVRPHSVIPVLRLVDTYIPILPHSAWSRV